MADYPFELKVHKLKDESLVAEIVVTEGIVDITHKVTEVIKPFLERYAFVIIQLGKSSALDYSVENTLKSLEHSDRVIIIAEKDAQVRFELGNLIRFCRIESALHVINGNFSVIKAVKNMSTSPILNQSNFRILKALKDPNMNFERLENILLGEEEVAQSIIDCANATKSEGVRSFATIKAVLSYYGLEGIRLILLEDIFKIFEKLFAQQAKTKIMHMKHSVFIMDKIADMLGTEMRNVRKYRVAGLYHDIGWLLLHHMFAQHYDQVWKLMAPVDENDEDAEVDQKSLAINEAEMKVFRITHQEVGELIAHEIGIPSYLIPAIAYHHNPDVYPNDIILQATVVANGFLNCEVDEMASYTPFENRFAVLNAEHKRLLEAKKDKGAYSIADLNNIDEDGNIIISDKFTLQSVSSNLRMAYDNSVKHHNRLEATKQS
jgi:putative nucleotidyltransferase with HDIG domain